MNEIRIKAKSSSGKPYEMVFTNHGDFFTVFCPCQAGIYGKLCKHKIQLLKHDEFMLHDPNDITTLTEIQSWVQASRFAAQLEEHSIIKKELEAAKKKEQKFRDTLEEAMKEGIPFIKKE